MINMDDLSILMAVTIDSTDRTKNLDIVIKYIEHYFDTNIIISEQSEIPILEGKYSNCEYTHTNSAEFFNRQRTLNFAARKATTPYICHYDADILLKPEQFITTMKLLREDKTDLCWPYDGRFYDVPVKFHSGIKDTHSLENINVQDMILFNAHSVGGAVFFKRDVFMEGGQGNEKMIGLGYEDNFLYEQFRKLGYRMMRVPGPLYHLTHFRGETSFNHNPYINKNRDEYLRMEKMTKEELIEDMKTWEWLK